MFNKFENNKIGDVVIVSTGRYNLFSKGTITKINNRYVYVKFITEKGATFENKYLASSGKRCDSYASFSEYITQWNEKEFNNYNNMIICERNRMKNENIIKNMNIRNLTDEQLEQIVKIISPKEIDA